MKNRLLIFLPVFFLVLWTLKQETVVKTGTTVELRVVGYDPRDLLSGHYLRYRVDYGPLGNCKGNNDNVCQCLEPEAANPPYWKSSGIFACSDRPAQCEVFLRGRCEPEGFVAGIERFYFPEKFTAQLGTVPPNASIEVAITFGSAVVKELKVEGVPFRQFLSR